MPYGDYYGREDIFICKFDANGDAVWAKWIISSDRDLVEGITIDNDNNIYIVGAFQGDSLMFQDGYPALINSYVGKYDAFLIKYDPSGAQVFAKRVFFGYNVQRLKDITYDFTNNCLVTVGQFQDSLAYDSSGYQAIAALSLKDHVLARFDTAGRYLDKTIFFGENKQSVFNHVNNCVIGGAVDGYFVTGDLRGKLYKWSGGGPLELLSAPDSLYMDIMVLRIDDNFSLDYLWGRKGGGSSWDHINASASDEFGNIYVAGKVESDTLKVDSTESLTSSWRLGYGGSDYFLVKYTRDGNLSWLKRDGGTGTDNAYGISVKEQKILHTADLYMGGNLTCNLIIYDLDGNLVLNDSIMGNGNESGLNAAFDQSGSVMLIGTFNGDSLWAGPDILYKTGDTLADGFFAKYNLDFKLLTENTTNILCNSESTGSIQLGTENETLPVTYVWTPSVSITNTASSLPAGIYKIVATDAIGKKDSVTLTLTEPDAIVIVEGSVSGTSCNTAANSGTTDDGTIDISVSGGLAPYVYSWSPGGQSTQDLTNESAGDHIVTVTDANLCEKGATINIPEPDPVTHLGTTLDTIKVPPGSNGAVHLNTDGGTADYSFSWTGPSGFTSSEDTITQLAFPGDYTITVTDNNSCVFDTVFNVPSDTILVIEICDTTQVSCKGGANGAAEVCITEGGTGSYSYAWRTLEGDPVGLDNPVITGLIAGTYIVRATDLGTSGSAETSITIEEPTTIHSLEFSPINYVACHGGADGSITVAVTGTGDFTFSWETGQETKDISGLTAGWYKVTVTDSAGCYVIDSTEIVQPSILMADITDSINVSIAGASDGSATVTPSGGSPPYSYSWDDDLGTVVSTVYGLSAMKWYHVIVTDDHLCTIEDSVILSEPGIFHIEITDSTDASCYSFSDGSATVTTSGGTPPYSFLWDDNAASTTPSVSNLLAERFYTVTVSDATAQMLKDSVYISQPESISFQKEFSKTICKGTNNGYIDLLVSGGIPPYTFNWSTGEYTSKIEDLSVGQYKVIITDANDCVAQDSTLIDSITTYQDSEICLVTVNNSNRILIVWEKTYNQGIAYYNIYREQSSRDNYVKIATIPFDSLSIFVDQSSVPEENPHFYKISVTDSCGNESKLSPLHKSIHLIANLGLNNEVNLNWDEYEGFDYFEYEIFRGNSLTSLFSIRTISASIRSWSDKSAPSGENFYRILVVKPDACFPTYYKSNEYSSPFSNYDEETIVGTNKMKVNSLNIFPNPMNSYTTIQFQNPSNLKYQLSVIDLSGKIVYYRDNIFNNSFELSRGKLSSGLYMIELIGPEIYRGKLLIE